MITWLNLESAESQGDFIDFLIGGCCEGAVKELCELFFHANLLLSRFGPRSSAFNYLVLYALLQITFKNAFIMMIEGYQINFELAEEGMAAVVGNS